MRGSVAVVTDRGRSTIDPSPKPLRYVRKPFRLGVFMQFRDPRTATALTSSCPHLKLYDPEFHRDHHAAYEKMRAEHGPVIPVELEPGVQGWLVIDYATIMAWCRDERTFSRDARRWRDWREGRVPDDAAVMGMMKPRPNALFSDG